MSIRSIAVVVVVIFAVTMCYSLPMNNEDVSEIGVEEKPLVYHVQIQYPIKRQQRYCYGVLLSEEYIAAPVYDCIDDFKVGEENYLIGTVGTEINNGATLLKVIRKKFSKLYNVITLARNIGIFQVEYYSSFKSPRLMKYDKRVLHATSVVTYGFGSLFSTGNTKLQKAESITVTRLRARLQYPVKVHQNYTTPVEINKAAIYSTDIGSPIIHEFENINKEVIQILLGLIVYADQDKWDDSHKTIILGTELCRKTIADALAKWMKYPKKTTFCSYTIM